MNDEILFAREDDHVDPLGVEEIIDSQMYLIFMAGHLKLGVVAEDVVEILHNQIITFLPMVPHYIRGIINMRGIMIPILDIRVRLGLEPRNDDNLVVVINFGDIQLGILVDAVDQMLDISKNNIHPLPANSTQALVSGMCSLPDGSGTMMVLDCAQLMPND